MRELSRVLVICLEDVEATGSNLIARVSLIVSELKVVDSAIHILDSTLFKSNGTIRWATVYGKLDFWALDA